MLFFSYFLLKSNFWYNINPWSLTIIPFRARVDKCVLTGCYICVYNSLRCYELSKHLTTVSQIPLRSHKSSTHNKLSQLSQLSYKLPNTTHNFHPKYFCSCLYLKYFPLDIYFMPSHLNNHSTLTFSV